MSTAQYGMVIDLRSCTGCQTCVISCKTANEVPEEGFWSHVIDYYEGRDLHRLGGRREGGHEISLDFVQPLRQPRVRRGLPHRSYAQERGNRHCISGSGYLHRVQHLRQYLPLRGAVLQEERCVMGKCNLCAGRLDQGKDPFCVQACPTRIRKVGLISDPESEVSKLIAEHNAQPYKPENDTSPSVYYILP